MKKAFTLIEMLVVIAIIGILAGVLMGTFGGSTESAHTARCLTNLKNLASACQSASVSLGHIPPAGSFEYVYATTRKGGQMIKQFREINGWISWDSEGKYQADSGGYYPTSHKGGSYISMYEDNDKKREYALTNGVLWKYVNGNHNIYLCPQHQRAMKAKNPLFSYVMNSYWGWDYSKGSKPISADNAVGIVHGTTSAGKADRILLFAEVQFVEHDGLTVPDGTGQETDCVLQFTTGKGSISISKGANTASGSSELIGFNHKSGKQYFANVVFADGHTEKLVLPKEGMSQSEIKELTTWLCCGVDYSFNGKKYEKFNN